MQIVETLADALACDVLDAAERLGDDTLVDQVSKLLLSTSSTMQEAFTTCIKVRVAERRARKFLDDVLTRKTSAA